MGIGRAEILQNGVTVQVSWIEMQSNSNKQEKELIFIFWGPVSIAARLQQDPNNHFNRSCLEVIIYNTFITTRTIVFMQIIPPNTRARIGQNDFGIV